jgi:sugar phosphate isomerase/epimerase
MKPVIAICRHAVESDLSACALAQEHDRPGVELTLNPEALDLSISRAGSLRSMLGSGAGMRYHFPLGSFDLAAASHVDADSGLHRMVQAVELLGESDPGAFLTVHAPLPTEARTGGRFLATRDRLQELVSRAAACGVAVAVENLRWGATSHPETLIELADTSGAVVTFDVGHATSSDVAADGIDAGSFVTQLGTRIKSAHVYERETDRHHAPENLDLIGPVLSALCAVGCPWWTIELTDPTDVRTTRLLLETWLDTGAPAQGGCEEVA